MTTKYLIVSDLHVGSNVAIMPDEVIIEPSDTQRAQRIESNPLQRILFKKWEEMIDEVGKVRACICGGDGCDGPNFKSRGFELWTPNLHQQCETAADLLGMIKTNKYYGVQGSLYHVGENTSSDLAIIEKLHGEFGTDLLITTPEGKVIHIDHEIGWSGSHVSKATAPQNEILSSKVYEPIIGNVDLHIRGHRHDWYLLRNYYGFIVGVPGWKGRDAFAAKKGTKMMPFNGYAVVEIHGNDIHVDHSIFVLDKKQLFKRIEG